MQAFSERTGLDRRTVARVLNRICAVDSTTLEQFFRAFNLTLQLSDYTKPFPNASKSESAFAYTRQDLREAVDVSTFSGRTSELALLEQWVINEHCRLVALLGIGGIGKTALATKLASQIRHHFEVVIWKSLRDAPPVKAILTNLIQFLSNEQETDTTLPKTVSGRIERLLDYLHKNRCLVVLDNAEAILCSGRGAGYYRDGYEEYCEA